MLLKKYVGVKLCVFLFVLLVVVGCNRPSLPTPPTATPTNTVTPSPTTCPSITLPTIARGTPVPFRTLYIVLYDPSEVHQVNMSLEAAMPVRQAIEVLMKEVVRGGDRVAIFQLGCHYYDYGCRLVNFVLPTPQVKGTLVPPSPTPMPTFTPAPSPTLPQNWTLFRATEVARRATQTATAVAPTATSIAVANECAISAWNKLYLDSAHKAEATQSAFATQIANMADTEVESGISSRVAQVPTPYTNDTVFDGLEQASIVLNNERNNFDRFVVLIFDTMQDWRVDFDTGKVHDLSFADQIDLQEAEVLMIMPDCLEVYDPPYCKTRSDVWEHLLIKDFGAATAVAFPNKQVFEKIIPLLRSAP